MTGSDVWDRNACKLPPDESLILVFRAGRRDFGSRLDGSRKGGAGGENRTLSSLRLEEVSGLSIRSTALIVDDEDEDVVDSRSTGRPCGLGSSFCSKLPPILCLVTGGRLCAELIGGLILDTNLGGYVIPGECEEMDVGVDVLLKGPGDSEARVEALLLRAASPAEGGAKSCVELLRGN